MPYLKLTWDYSFLNIWITVIFLAYKLFCSNLCLYMLCCLRSTFLTCSTYTKLCHLCIFSTWIMKWVLRCLFLNKFHCPAFSSIDDVSSFGSPDDWECFLHYLGCLLEDGSIWCDEAVNDPVHPPKFVSCKVSHLSDEQVNILSLRVFN
jgi:hypothetical protein